MDDEIEKTEQLQDLYKSDQKRTNRREQFQGEGSSKKAKAGSSCWDLPDSHLDWSYEIRSTTDALEHRVLTALTYEYQPNVTKDHYKYFSSLWNKEDENEEEEERIAVNILLGLKNGTSHQTETSLVQLIDNAREFGAGPLFNGILKLLMHPTLEDQERHLLLKATCRIVFELDELVRPYVHKILVVVEPLLVDEDDQVRVGGREIIYNLSKAAGLDSMIDAMWADIHSLDEYVRKATARSFSIVVSALGILALLPFLREACQSGKSWQARYTGIMIVQQIIILIDVDVLLPHLRSLVEIIKPRLKDDIKKVRTIASLALADLAQTAAPCGIEI